MAKKSNLIMELCEAVMEMSKECDNDLCGEQREFYNPRIKKATKVLAKLYPNHVCAVLMAGEESS